MWTSPEEANRAQATLEGRSYEPHVERGPTITASAFGAPPVRFGFHDGEKFAGGFGATTLYVPDYWTLRARSGQLFRTNLYARGIIERLVTNEINTGLHLEATPEESVLGLPEDSLSEWTEDVENRFALWGGRPELCDKRALQSFGGLQATVRAEALIDGDVLIVLEQNRKTLLPVVRVYSGGCVQTPIGVTPQRGNKISHGVEMDDQGRQVAYWIRKENREYKRLPAWGEKSGRRIAWLVYGSRKRVDEVRGEPLLARVLQSLREIDRYRDATQRKAQLGSMMLGWVEKGEDKPGSRFMQGGGISRTNKTQVDQTATARTFQTVEQIPGWFAQELQVGETVKFNNHLATDEKFTDFESAILYGVAWSLEIPPEILTLSFNANYSASQAAINEFKMYLDRIRQDFGQSFCSPIYSEWLLSEVLNERIKADGFLSAWRDPMQYDVLSAWLSSDWSGHIKPSTDILKQAKGYNLAIGTGLTDLDRATREFSGQKHSKVVKKLKRQVAMLREAGIVADFMAEPAAQTEPGEPGANARSMSASVFRLSEIVDELDERVAG